VAVGVVALELAVSALDHADVLGLLLALLGESGGDAESKKHKGYAVLRSIHE
jgi:hypothetical protein